MTVRTAESRIPIILVTGFLGTGKTTLLRRWMTQHAQRRLAYLVNEFSVNDVDGAILEADDEKVVTVPGGSIFCTCLVSAFISRLRHLYDHYHLDGNPLEKLIIEASGMANPRVMGDMLRETGLDAHYRLQCVVTIVSPQTFPKLMITLPNVKAQVEAANLIVINRIDTATPAQLLETREQINALAPGTTVIQTQFAELELDALPAQNDSSLHGEYAKCRDPNYTSISVDYPTPPRLEPLLAALRHAAPLLYRAKGIIQTDQGWQLIELADGLVTHTPLTVPNPSGRTGAHNPQAADSPEGGAGPLGTLAPLPQPLPQPNANAPGGRVPPESSSKVERDLRARSLQCHCPSPAPTRPEVAFHPRELSIRSRMEPRTGLILIAPGSTDLSQLAETLKQPKR